MGKKPKIEFSWSYSKFKLFHCCERAYYFHYYKALKGYDYSSSSFEKEIYFHKNLVNKELWLTKIIRSSLFHTLAEIKLYNSYKFKKLFKNHAIKKFNYEFKQLITENWKSDPRSLNLQEIYYKEKTSSEIGDYIINDIKKIADNLSLEESFKHLKKFPYQTILNPEKPIYFFLQGIKIWCSPLLISHYKGNINIFVLNYHSNFKWADIMGINTLYAMKKWNENKNNIIPHTLFVDEKDPYVVFARRSTKELESIIKKSTDEMLSRLTFHGKAFMKNFPATSKEENCQKCKFRKICHFYLS